MATVMKMFLVTVAVLAASFHSSMAATYVVGDALGWTFPSNPATYSTWASGKSFAVGDVLVFNFTSGSHTVAEVSKNSFDSCSTASPISLTTNGPAKITLSTAGAHYFLCTVTGHCGAGQKLAINVSAAPSTSPAPAPPPASPSPPPAPVPTPEPTSAPSPAPKTSPAPAPSKSTPKTYVVGDNVGWTVPPRGFSYESWAKNKTFHIGDILVFNFTTGAHNVAVLPSKAAYDSCNSSGVKPTTTGPARITLTAGQHFYICTVPSHCSLGQKLTINVTGTASTPAPGPSPTSGETTPPPSSSTPPPSSPGAVSAPPPPSSAPSFAGAALPLTLLAVAFAFFY